jgi:DNA-binding XRE family transcriptional regulator
MAKRVRSETFRQEWAGNFAKYLKSKRKRNKLTQARLADCVHINVNTVRKMEYAEHIPSRELASDIGELFSEPYSAMAAAGYIPFLGWAP